MGYRIVADEHVEPATMNYLRKLGHDVERVATGGVGVPSNRFSDPAEVGARIVHV
jgi:hypothetical protein